MSNSGQHSQSSIFQYAPLLILLTIFALKERVQLKGVFFQNMLLFGFSILLTIVGGRAYGLFGIREFGVILATFFLYSFTFSPKHEDIKQQSLAFGLSYVIFKLITRPFPIDFNPIMGISSWEDNNYSYILGYFAVYFAVRGDRKLFWFNYVLMMLAMKRTLILVVSLVALITFIRESSLKLKPFRRVEIFIAFFLLFMYVSLSVDVLLDAVLELGLITDPKILTGRDYIVANIKALIDGSRTMITDVLGFGPGYSTIASQALLSNYINQVHNDYLRIALDYGLLGLITWTVIYAKFVKESSVAFFLMIVQTILFVTDNTFINFPVIFVMYGMIRSDLELSSQKAELEFTKEDFEGRPVGTYS